MSQMPNSCALFDRSTVDDSFLASQIEIVAILAQLADRRTGRRRALGKVLPEILSHKASAIIPTHNVAPLKTSPQISADSSPEFEAAKACPQVQVASLANAGTAGGASTMSAEVGSLPRDSSTQPITTC